MTENHLFELRQIRKTHGANFTLDVPRLDVARGDVVALLGPTGAGKSTLLRMLAALERPTSGDVHFDGQSLASPDLPLTTRRRIVLVHQQPVLLTGTVRLNAEYGLRIRGRLKETQMVDRMLERLRLSEIASQSSQSLSGGQTQLLALARALVIEPDVLLVDEPTAHLDPARVALVEETIGRLQKERGMTVLWATHNLFQARRVSSRTALLWNGELVEAAPTTEFFNSPSDPRTIDFVQGRLIY